MKHPFLQKDFEIRWSSLTPDQIETDITQALHDAQAAVDAVAEGLGDVCFNLVRR